MSSFDLIQKSTLESKVQGTFGEKVAGKDYLIMQKYYWKNHYNLNDQLEIEDKS